MEPLIMLFDMYTHCILTRPPIEDASTPLNSFFSGRRNPMDFIFPIEDGMLPLSLLLKRYKRDRLVDIPIESGMLLVSLLSDLSRRIQRLQKMHFSKRQRNGATEQVAMEIKSSDVAETGYRGGNPTHELVGEDIQDAKFPERRFELVKLDWLDKRYEG